MRRRRDQQRADAFQDAVQGLPVDDATLARESAELVRYAEAVLRAEHPRADATFVAELRRQVLDDAVTVLTLEPPPRVVRVRAVSPERSRARARRRAGSLVAAFVVATGSFGLLGASAQALPGEALYPVKLGVENVELGLQRGPTGTGRKQLELASERLGEAEALAADGVTRPERDLVRQALTEFGRRARAGTNDLLRAYAVHGTTSGVRDVDAFAGSSGRALQRLQDVLPVADTTALYRAALTVRGIGASAAAACDECTTAETARTVEDLVGGGAAPTAPDPAPARGTRPSAPAPSAAGPTARNPRPSAGAPSAVAPPAQPSASAPTTAAPEAEAPLRSITDPLLSGLLGEPTPSAEPTPGDDPSAEALIPGLIDELLSTPTPAPTP